MPAGTDWSFLVLIDSPDDQLSMKETDVKKLCAENRKATLKELALINPSVPLFLESKAHPGQVIDVRGGHTTNGTALTLWTKHAGNNQKFFFEPASDGYHYIKNVHSQKIFDYSTKLLQWERNGGHHQQFKLVPAGNGYYYIEIKRFPNQCLQVGGHGKDIVLGTIKQEDNKLFKITN